MTKEQMDSDDALLMHLQKVDIMLTDDDLGYYSILHNGEFIEKDFKSRKKAEKWAKENNLKINTI